MNEIGVLENCIIRYKKYFKFHRMPMAMPMATPTPMAMVWLRLWVTYALIEK